jgi:hypothetical protein
VQIFINTRDCNNLTDVHAVIIFLRIILVNIWIDEMSWIQVIPIRFPAFNDQFSFSECRGGDLYRSGTGVKPDAAILSPSRPERVPKSCSAFRYSFGKAVSVNVSYWFNEIECVASRAHNDHRTWFAPHDAKTAPGNRHGVILTGFEITAGQQQPLLFPQLVWAVDELC